jgi:type II secretory pathway pseudopilin PulG
MKLTLRNLNGCGLGQRATSNLSSEMELGSTAASAVVRRALAPNPGSQAAAPSSILHPPSSSASASSAQAGFTMVEIALCLAIIGFALVAIIGVLPAGLNVQRENREETIIVHDANYLIEAIRAGSRGLDDLTNYVEAITNYTTEYRADNSIVVRHTYAYTYTDYVVDGAIQPPSDIITNGARIIGLLSTPKYVFRPDERPFLSLQTPVHQGFTSNYIVAYVRALSGSAVEKAPQANAIVRDLSFRYRLICELTPAVNWSTNWTDYKATGLTPAESYQRSNFWRTAQLVQQNQTELRLIFRWPIKGNREAGNQRQVFRTLVGGVLTLQPDNGVTNWWFIQPQTYQATR